MKLFVAAATAGLVVTALLASVKLAEAIKATSLDALRHHPGKFHHAKVIVKGTASQVEIHYPRRGGPSTTFVVTEPATAASIEVSSRGAGTVREGAMVSVEGVFDRTTERIVAYSIRARRE
jgi:hypothetical protein